MFSANEIMYCADVLSKIKPGEKISVRGGLLSIDKKPNAFIRWLSGDSKYVALMYIQIIVDNAIFMNVKIDPIGLKNLQETYSDSKGIFEALELLIQKINNVYIINEH